MLKLPLQLPFFLLCALLLPVTHASEPKKSGHDRVITLFTDINKFYRNSGAEKEIREYIEKYVTSRVPGSQSQTDEIGNLLIQIPAQGTKKKSLPISLQGHLDMVHDVSPEVKKRFPDENVDSYFKNGVTVVYENGFGKSKNSESSIGADNGIGLAIMMVLATESDLSHPPLELLFTVSEEKGLLGGKHLQLPIRAKEMINLDSFYYGVLTNSCTGSKRLDLKMPLPSRNVPNIETKWKAVEIKLDGLKGGHSGEDIYKNRLNAVLLMTNLIDSLRQKTGAQLLSAHAGDANVFNKIPSEFKLNLLIPEQNLSQAVGELDKFKLDLMKKVKLSLKHSAYPDEERFGEDAQKINLEHSVTDWDVSKNSVVVKDDTLKKLLEKTHSIPNGIIAKNNSASKKVETSANLAFFHIQATADNQIQLHAGWMPRSFKNSDLAKFQSKVETQFGLKVEPNTTSAETVTKDAKLIIPSESPAWEAGPNSKLMKKFQNHLKYTKQKPFKVEGTLGGMEVTWFLKKFPDLDVISIGPTIHDAHSYRENFELESVEKLYNVLAGFLEKESK